MRWYAMLQQIDKEEFYFVRTDFNGNNFFNIIPEGSDGIDFVTKIIDKIIVANQEITIGIDKLACPFKKNSTDIMLWEHLIKKYASNFYQIKPVNLNNDENLVYLSKENVGIAQILAEKCSILLIEGGSVIALRSYLSGVTPPFHPFDVTLLGCSLIKHLGLLCCFRSITFPPSSQDIETFMRAGKDDPFINSVVGSDIVWFMFKTAETPLEYDKGEFHLQFMETVSKFEIFGGLIGHKMAVIETCRKYNLALYAGNFGKPDNHEKVEGAIDEKKVSKTDITQTEQTAPNLNNKIFKILPLELQLAR